MSKMHSPARHQTGEDAKRLFALMCTEYNVQIAMGKDNTTPMQFGCIGQIQSIKRRQTELLYNPCIVCGLVASPRVNAYRIVTHGLPSKRLLESNRLEAFASIPLPQGHFCCSRLLPTDQFLLGQVHPSSQRRLRYQQPKLHTEAKANDHQSVAVKRAM